MRMTEQFWLGCLRYIPCSRSEWSNSDWHIADQASEYRFDPRALDAGLCLMVSASRVGSGDGGVLYIGNEHGV